MPLPPRDPELELSPEDVRGRLERGEIQLVDVREAYEHEAGHVEGDRHIPVEQLAARAEAIDRDRPVVFYCRVGARSGMAAGAFRRAGYDARNMVGGLVAWAERDLPLAPENGAVADH